MKARDADLLNRRARMSQAERDEDIVRSVFGPMFESIFGGIPRPESPTDEPKDVAGEARRVNLHG